ncbi:MAG: class A beta-lactamase, subclass A2 [Raineya sp.]|jgi:beta-lactamase class A|nr:class A beta-lactamase, subclass A2 [Raineya sp.]
MYLKLFFSILFTLFFTQNIISQSIRKKIDSLINTKKAEIGIAIYDLQTKDTITWGNHRKYPMQSVYKFHLALAVLNHVDKGKLSLEQKILVKKSDLLPNTWSPLREKYPQGNIELPLSEIIHYTVAASDNNGCDILFRLLGGTKKVHQYIKSLGIKEIAIKATEEEMHKEWNVQFTNWTTPLATVQLLQIFHQKNILSKKSQEFLWKTMIETSTGLKRMKYLLPKNTIVAHKTGTSGDKDGITSAINDMGIIQLPNGNYIAVCVFVSNSKESFETNEQIIADITKLIWDYYVNK